MFPKQFLDYSIKSKETFFLKGSVFSIVLRTVFHPSVSSRLKLDLNITFDSIRIKKPQRLQQAD